MTEKPRRIGAAVLASGFSSRLGQNKLFLSIGGRTLLERSLEVIPKSTDRLVVTQYPEAEETARRLGAAYVYNDKAAEGASASIRLAARYFYGFDALLLLVCDQPFLKMESLQRLLDCSGTFPDSIVCAAQNGLPRNPAIFPHSYFDALLKLTGGQSGKKVVAAGDMIPVEFSAEELYDIDTMEDYINAVDLV